MAYFNDSVSLKTVSKLSILESPTLEFFANYYNENYTNYLKLSYNNTDICTINCGTHTVGQFIRGVADLSNYKEDILSHFLSSSSLNFTVSMWSVNSAGEKSNSNTQGVTIYLDKTLASPEIDMFFYKDINDTTVALTGDDKKIINGFSFLQLYGLNVVTKEYATITNWTVQVGSSIINEIPTDGVLNFGYVPSFSNNTITLTVIDNRGLTATRTINYIGCSNYIKPNITSCVLTRPDKGNGLNLSLTGTYVSTIGDTVKNTITQCRYRYKEISSNTWSEYLTFANMDESIVPVTLDDDNFSYNDVLDYSVISPKYSYEIQIYIEDNLSTTTHNEVTLRTIPLVSEGFGRFGINTSSPNASIDIRTTDDIYLIDNIDYHISEDEFHELESLSGVTWLLTVDDPSNKITINRVASSEDGALGAIVDGATIYYGDVLNIKSKTSLTTIYINDNPFDYKVNQYTATKGDVRIRVV